uniref:Uncharacterized protein LOC110208990 n=1 Tax=Phascolarctos cinereus TaxID=38626 RepID=A0A6P5KBJ3_PHACI|nr:uncharacterized protein LOC110208990 [Phascolarctos cinereus]
MQWCPQTAPETALLILGDSHYRGCNQHGTGLTLGLSTFPGQQHYTHTAHLLPSQLLLNEQPTFSSNHTLPGGLREKMFSPENNLSEAERTRARAAGSQGGCLLSSFSKRNTTASPWWSQGTVYLPEAHQTNWSSEGSATGGAQRVHMNIRSGDVAKYVGGSPPPAPKGTGRRAGLARAARSRAPDKQELWISSGPGPLPLARQRNPPGPARPEREQGGGGWGGKWRRRTRDQARASASSRPRLRPRQLTCPAYHASPPSWAGTERLRAHTLAEGPGSSAEVGAESQCGEGGETLVSAPPRPRLPPPLTHAHRQYRLISRAALPGPARAWVPVPNTEILRFPTSPVVPCWGQSGLLSPTSKIIRTVYSSNARPRDCKPGARLGAFSLAVPPARYSLLPNHNPASLAS